MSHLLVTFVCLTLALAGLSTDAAAATKRERAVLVLDASGSMWGQIEQTPKITVARNVIGKLVRDWNPKVLLGLTAYGHREKGNCADIESLLPVGKVDANAIMAVVNQIRPKGKTPLSEAVRQAARDLKYTEERATVILVSDGKETCNADPCAVASELESSGVDFTVHVVGFDLTNAEKAQLRCMADNTGGKFFTATSASQLHKAMATTIRMVAEAKPAKQRTVKVKSVQVGSLRIKGVRGRPAFVYAPGKTYKQAIASFGPRRKKPLQLNPGTYIIAKRHQAMRKVDVAAGQDVVVDLAAATGSLLLKGVRGRPVFTYTPGKTYKQALVRFDTSGNLPVQLRPGAYMIGKRNQELAQIEIVAGQDKIVDMADVTGSVTLKGVVGKNVFIYEPGKTYKQALARFEPTRNTPEQLLPGKYVVGTKLQEIATIELKPGEALTVDLSK